MTAAVGSLLSVRQRRILDFIRGYFTEYGYAPSLRDIGDHVGLVSASSVKYQVEQLERMGWIRRAPNTARALVVLNPADGSDT